MITTAFFILIFAFCVLVIHGGITDIRTFRIPNWVSAALALGFIPYAALRWGDIPLFMHVFMGASVFIICLVFWRFGWLGGGDVKFLGAISFWMGPQLIVPFIFILSLSAALFAAILMWVRRWNPYIQQSGLPAVFKQLIEKAENHACPYGFPIAIAAIAMVPSLAD
jgi:prepilin peptidase CpaA